MQNQLEPLFTSDADWHNNACLNFLHDMSYGYIEGYKKAAELLINHVDQMGRDQDYLVYPIVFLYRQHIELLLKNIIKKGRQLLDEGSDHPTHHKLHDLWPIAKGITIKIWNITDPQEFKLIDHVITEFSNADPASMSFRYSNDKNGNKPNPTLTYINLRHFGETIDNISSYLDGINVGINDFLKQKPYTSD